MNNMSTNPHSLPPETEPWWLPEENQQQQQQEAHPFPMEPIRVQPIRIWRPDQPQSLFHVVDDDNNNNHYHHLYQQQQQQQEQFAVVGNEMKELMFEKALTPSDVGKLNRLVIPKSKAEAHLPAGADGYSSAHGKGLILDLEDENGKWWNFRYSYWHSSQSYVLTKGWTRYVKEKQLEAGDVVMFQRHRFQPNRFFVSWRRRLPGATPPARQRRTLADAEAGTGTGTASGSENENEKENEDENENNNNNSSGGYSLENSESTVVVGRVREFYPEFLPYPTKQDQHLSYNPDFLAHAGGGSEAPNEETTTVENGADSASGSGSGGCWVFGVNFG